VTNVINHSPLTRHISVNSSAFFQKTRQKCYTPLLKCLYIKIITIPYNYVKEVSSIWFLLSSFQTCFWYLGLHHQTVQKQYLREVFVSQLIQIQVTEPTPSIPAPSIYTSILSHSTASGLTQHVLTSWAEHLQTNPVLDLTF
jgi:cellobiose-specific phosphotransferase system component IIC